MATVNELKYERVSREELEGALQQFMQRNAAATCAEDVIAARTDFMRTYERIYSMISLAFCRNAQNSKDEFYAAEREYYDALSPEWGAMESKVSRALLTSPFRKQLEEKLGRMLFTAMEYAVKAQSDDCIQDEQEENALTTQYERLMSTMQFDWKGEKIPLSVLRGELENGDAGVRKAAAQAIGRGLAAHREELDDIYDRLVKVRDRIARKLGYENYVPLGYYLLKRYGYTREMVEAFRENVVTSLVPVIARLKEWTKGELGLEKMLFSDNDVYKREGNPKFALSPEQAFDAAQKMYDEMDGEVGAFFRSMCAAQAFDVVARDGKYGGGFCDYFSIYHQAFILANFNGTTGDADVLTHEFGHAYAMHACDRPEVDPKLNIGGMETAECHSMSMEFLSWKFMRLFFGDEERAYRFKHLADSLSFIPYGCLIDEFQQRVYENPQWTPKERNSAYAALEKKYRPYLSFEGLDYLEEGTRWQYQMHVYASPFYYIDYCLAQTVALGFLCLSQEDYKEALARYKAFAAKGGSKPFPQLVEEAGLASPFAQGALEELGRKVEAILNDLKS